MSELTLKRLAEIEAAAAQVTEWSGTDDGMNDSFIALCDPQTVAALCRIARAAKDYTQDEYGHLAAMAIGELQARAKDYEAKWYTSNKNLNAAWDRAEKAEAERDALRAQLAAAQVHVTSLRNIANVINFSDHPTARQWKDIQYRARELSAALKDAK